MAFTYSVNLFKSCKIVVNTHRLKHIHIVQYSHRLVFPHFGDIRIIYFHCDILVVSFRLLKMDQSQNVESFEEQIKENVLLF